MSDLAPGTRVRMNEKSPWPGRVGVEGMIVAPKTNGTYPQPGQREVLVYLDRDPLHGPGVWWSCVTSVDSVDVVNAHIARSPFDDVAIRRGAERLQSLIPDPDAQGDYDLEVVTDWLKETLAVMEGSS